MCVTGTDHDYLMRVLRESPPQEVGPSEPSPHLKVREPGFERMQCDSSAPELHFTSLPKGAGPAGVREFYRNGFIDAHDIISPLVPPGPSCLD